MDQHPIPQHISSYEFKLVGEMTLKQFLKLAAGLVLAFIIYSSKLIFILKWPLVLVFAGLGVVLAFVPFQDRPMDLWIKIFIKSIYSPTIYIYKKRPIENWLDIDPNFKSLNKEDYDDIVPTYQKSHDKFRKFVKIPSVGNQNVYDELKVNEKPLIKEEEVISENKAILQDNVVQKSNIIQKPEEKIEDWRLKESNLDLEIKKESATGTANFGSIPIPSVSTIPNVIIGMITDKNGKLMEGVIVEIQDEKGNPARVLKTNPLGQFKTTTPLSNGKYLIIPEKEGNTFDKINVVLDGSVLQPLRMMPL